MGQVFFYKSRICRFSILLGILGGAILAGCNGQHFAQNATTQSFGEKVNYNTDVDILWVIDTSQSMSQHHNDLSVQIESFVSALNSLKLNYHIGVINMDRRSSGKLLYEANEPKYFDNSTENLAQLLGARIKNLGNQGSSIERGEESMHSALTEPNLSNANQGFLRDSALLNVIFMSDEHDQSAISDYKTFLDQLKPPLASGARSWIAHFIGVIPEDPTCVSGFWNLHDSGVEYIALVNQSGGSSQSICTLDLTTALKNVKARILEVITEYRLTSNPIVESISVFINGQKLANDSMNGWTYVPEHRSILFHGTGIPQPDATINVEFKSAGGE